MYKWIVQVGIMLYSRYSNFAMINTHFIVEKEKSEAGKKNC